MYRGSDVRHPISTDCGRGVHYCFRLLSIQKYFVTKGPGDLRGRSGCRPLLHFPPSCRYRILSTRHPGITNRDESPPQNRRNRFPARRKPLHPEEYRQSDDGHTPKHRRYHRCDRLFQAVSHSFSRPYKFRHICLPTGKTAMMFTHLFSVHRKDRMAIYPVETKNDPFPFIIGRKGK